MRKNFWPWHRLKHNLNHRSDDIPYFRGRQVWFCSLGLNIGHEQDGANKRFERPVIIFKKINRFTFLAVPLSTQIRNDKYHFCVKVKHTYQCAKLAQIRLLDARRLRNCMDTLSEKSFESLKQSFIEFIQ